MNCQDKDLWFSVVVLCFAVLFMVSLKGCATSANWTDLVKEAEPEFSLGKCGPQVTWHKTLVVYEKADVEATVVVKAHCKDKGSPPNGAP